MKLSILFVLLLLSCPVWAAGWTYLGTPSDADLGMLAYREPAYVSNQVYSIDGETAYLVRVADSSGFMYFAYEISCPVPGLGLELYGGIQPYSLFAVIYAGPHSWSPDPRHVFHGIIKPGTLGAKLASLVCKTK